MGEPGRAGTSAGPRGFVAAAFASVAVFRAAVVAPTATSRFAPRPLRTARSSAADGRADGSGARHRCSDALTSAFVAGPGITPASRGGVAAYARTSRAYSA